MRTINNIRIGTADVAPDAPAHIEGVPQGNEPGALQRMPGFESRGRMTVATPARSTGINADRKGPIVPGAPTLTPA